MSTQDSARSALCVIDIQKDFTRTNLPFSFKLEQVEGLIANTNEAIARAQEQGMKIVYVRHEYSSPLSKLFAKVVMSGRGIAGKPGVDIDPRNNVVSDHIFTKGKPSAFSNPELGKFLKANQIDTLYIAGLDGCMCVNGTIKAALKEGYKVNVVTDAVISGFKGRWKHLMESYVKRGISLTWAADF